MNKKQILHLSAMQGRAEQRSEPYFWYGERAAQALTQQCAKSTAGLAAPLASWACGAGVACG